MKTQVIQLDPHDDVVSVRDRLGWARAGRIVLIWPDRGHILERQLDLVLLRRFAQRNGVQIGLVTKDPLVIEHAKERNIPVFEDVLHAQQGRWRSGRRQRRASRLTRPNREDSPAIRRQPPASQNPATTGWSRRLLRAGLFTASLLAFLAVLASLLPGATIVVQQPHSEQVITLPLQAAREAVSGQFPLQTTTIVVEARSSQTTSGQVTVPEKTAKGSIQFTNLTEETVTVPEGTVVTTLSEPVVRFATTKGGTVPAGIGKTLLVDIAAVNPGEQGNLQVGSLQAIEGSLGLSLTARNIYAVRGGSDQEAAGPSQADREALLQRMLVELEAQARKEILNRWQTNPLNNSFPITETLRLDEILEQTYTPAEDWPSSELTLRLQVSFSAEAIAGDQLIRFFETAMDSELAPGQKALDGELKFLLTEPPSLVSGADETWAWQIQASRPIQQTFQSGEISERSRLLPAHQAAQILAAALGMEEAPVVTVWPAWWPYLPVTSMRIRVVVAP